MAYSSYSSYGSKPYEPIVINPPSVASNMNVQELQEYIRDHPRVLNKESKEEEKVEIKSHKKRKTESDSDEDEKNIEEYISKNEVEIEKLEDTIRYLKLDLNNEQLKVNDLTDLLKEEGDTRYRYETVLEYVMECIRFMERKPFFIEHKGRVKYNVELIELSKKYSEMEKVYHSLLDRKKTFYISRNEKEKLDCSPIYEKYDKEIRQKYRELDNSYKEINERLTDELARLSRPSYLSYFFAILVFFVLERLFFFR